MLQKSLLSISLALMFLLSNAQIAEGSINLPSDDVGDRLYTMQQQLYEVLKANPNISVNSNDLHDFIVANQWSSLDFISYASKFMAEGKINYVEILLSYWQGQEKLDDNYYKYFEWLVNMSKDPKYKPNTQAVFELANQCPAKNGLVVYAARNLYNLLTNTINSFNEECNANTYSRGAKQNGFTRLKDVKKEKLIVYPNPAKSIVNIEWAKIKTIEIVDLLGKSIMLKEVGNSNKSQLDISNFKKGMYILKVIDKNNSLKIDKLIIQ